MDENIKENEYAYDTFLGQKVSKNDKAKIFMGYRNEGHPGANALFGPAELGYACPVCDNENIDRLDWSEYAGFIWCPTCNLDIPSCLCIKYAELEGKPMDKKMQIIQATDIFLDTVESSIRRQITIIKSKEAEG